MKELSRRNFMKGLAGVTGVAALGALSGMNVLAEENAISYTPGTYSATAIGMGKVTVSMTFDETSITDVQVDVSEETDTIGQAIGQALQNLLMKDQSADIDAISGATVTSEAVKKAAASCIAQALGLEDAPAEAQPKVIVDGITQEEMDASAVELQEITDAQDGGEYDVIVIGAGATGVPCAVKAYQDGAKVLLLQKEPNVVSQGNSTTGIDLENSDDAAILDLLHQIDRECQWRADFNLLKVWAYNSGEAVKWMADEANAAGYGETCNPTETEREGFGRLTRLTDSCLGKPDNISTALTAIIDAYRDKFDMRFSTPAVQLVKEGSKVTGVIAKDEEGTYYKFTALKGVVLATGDYQNNAAMVAKWCPDVSNFEKKQYHKTGDGHLMGIAAGGVMERIGHTKMLHDFDSGVMFDEPFLRVDLNGKRFHNEDLNMDVSNNDMRYYPLHSAGKYAQIFDNNYMEQATEWGGRPADEDTMKRYMPEEDDPHQGTVRELINTYRADTLEELAEKIDIPADALKETVDRYNELVDLGYDADFGKNPKYMKKIETAPFWAIKKSVRVSAICSGIMINTDFQVLDKEGSPIEGLYCAGNCSGGFYGGVDYPLSVPGLSLGRCVTGGYVIGRALAAK